MCRIQQTSLRQYLSELIDLLKSETKNEFELAKLLLYTTRVLQARSEITLKDEKVHTYILTTKRFYERAQQAEFQRRFREDLKKKFSATEQRARDIRLFEHEGMLYILEYYLALYEKIQSAQTEEEKRRFVESSTIDLGFGDVPGLIAEIQSREAIEKFIGVIMDDDVRETLLRAFYDVLETFDSIEFKCKKQDTCTVDYQGIQFSEVIESFKQFLVHLLDAYQKMGIEKLSSFFFTPFGKKPLISSIKL